MSIAQEEYEEILKIMKEKKIDPKILKIINDKHGNMIKNTMLFVEKAHEMGIENAIKYHQAINAPKEVIGTLKSCKDKRFMKFFKWISKESNHKYYIVHMSNDSAVSFMTRDLNVLFKLKLCNGNDSVVKFFGKVVVLDIETIYSFQKGEGYKVMKNVLSFAKRHGLLVSLWTETEENVKYFERYGFVNYGNHGDNNEYLMILEQNKL